MSLYDLNLKNSITECNEISDIIITIGGNFTQMGYKCENY